ncbi:MAG: tetratricopeptide repeat protein, partial [Myxococcaceae bacterium]
MYNLLLSVAAGLLVGLLIKLLGYPLLASVVPGVIVLLGAYVWLARRIALKVQAISKQAEKELSVQTNNTRERQQRVEKAVAI